MRDAPAHLAQMRGVLSVLGLDQAAQAVLRMRESVEEIIVTEIDEERARAAGTFDKLGNNLGALGFLIDMLNYQPSLAKKLFVYDDSTGELRPLMGRAGQGAPERADHADELQSDFQALVAQVDSAGSREDLTAKLDSIAAHAVLAEQTVIAHQAREAAAAMAAEDSGATAAALSTLAASVQHAPLAAVPAPAEPDIEEDDLRDIFLEEAREVVQNGLAALQALAANPGDVSEMTTLRRAFHTLKGSSRMVGLDGVRRGRLVPGAGAQYLAGRPEAGRPMTCAQLASDAMRGFARWTEDIAANNDGMWKANMFRAPADAMRTEHRLVPLALPQDEPASQPAEFDVSVNESEAIEPAVPDHSEAMEAPSAELANPEPELQEAEPAEAEVIDAISFDFDITAAVPAEPSQAPVAVDPAQPVALDISGRRIAAGFRLGPVSRRRGTASGGSARGASGNRRYRLREPVGRCWTGGLCPTAPHRRRPLPSPAWSSRSPRPRANSTWIWPISVFLPSRRRRLRRGRRGAGDQRADRRTGQGHRNVAHRHSALQRLPQRGRRMVPAARDRGRRVGTGVDASHSRLNGGPGPRAGRKFGDRRLQHACPTSRALSRTS